ncbi:hypothetical protein GA0074696_0230 [Micromonospora purpureochromogenes]|uniref:Uncharacterized protein n=1 Tax=Micromonospora purpureochromogenes TaxID=47872 RepID=A0A1C4UAM0_9ACTN|nr:hypothetical protein [Micromonospora purpureochromogenes]SCE68696.1 hypothetical protein GA0074696_0230 [Micromonospora purpureochromogenes]
MADSQKQSANADRVRELARQGRLAQYFWNASAEERRLLRTGAFEIAWQLVFLRITQPIERRRHHVCAKGVPWLAPDCLDRFHHDVEAVLDDLFAHADVPIENLEGWLVRWMQRATVDGYRRRRGERGAPQRPRVPKCLVTALGDDPWLVELARLILDWVGTDTSAGGSLWPLAAWAERRAGFTGDHHGGESAVSAEVEVVLAAMRRRPGWYERTVEAPLGRKQAPVSFSAGHPESEPLALVAQHEKDDSLLQELAARAIDLLERRMKAGEDLHILVTDVLTTVFGELTTEHDLGRSPGEDPVDPDRVAALISDRKRLDHIVATIVDLLGRRNRPSEP